MPGQIAQAGMGLDQTAVPNYRDRITAIRDSLGGARTELIVRFLLPGIGVSLIAVLIENVTVFIFYLFYLLTEAMLYGYFATRQAHCTRAEYILALCLAALSSGAFVATAIYMWWTMVPLAQFGAFCLVSGFAIFLLARNSLVVELIIIDAVAILIGSVNAGVSFAITLSDQAHPAVTLSFALMILTYFMVSLHSVYDTRVKLRRAEDRAIVVERLEAVGRLTGGVAHEFNNILTAVLGHLDLYGHLTHPSEKDSCVAAAHQAATRAANLTSQLLFFARKARLSAVATDLTEYLTVFADRAGDFLPKSIDLRTVLSANLPIVMVDRDNLDIVLLQLVLNARDALGEAGTLTLALEHLVVPVPRKMQGATELAPGSYCVIRVEDDGIGISPAHLTRIFEPFFTTKTKGQAAGLGLPMVAGFAEMSGGAVSVSSQLGVGAAVQLYLPTINAA